MSISEKRIELIKTILKDEVIADEENEILHQLLDERISRNTVTLHDEKLTFGQKAADRLAKFAGSWTFIILFFITLTAWIILNAVILTRPYDVYPFILLNLALSCLAAIQAPVIMMSQNRQEEKDRIRAKNDYKVNLKSEIIVEDIHQKLDAILENQENILSRVDLLEKNKNE
ncbi:DUF1003 domain-containing protein [Acetobacterium bakii]|uniref:Membrane protein n=1 Tax=Acetobacterium bakii TaxID=52689 RepID=A0A0L6U2N8_9FIRM|nr:DUF1003 domain-containing protein [Acetobacterium bakii]KNZ42617.1 membrane protein [Acetobacterium bakii]